VTVERPLVILTVNASAEELFPDAEHRYERFFGPGKSLIAVRR
jgi:hypothetical protein